MLFCEALWNLCVYRDFLGIMKGKIVLPPELGLIDTSELNAFPRNKRGDIVSRVSFTGR